MYFNDFNFCDLMKKYTAICRAVRLQEIGKVISNSTAEMRDTHTHLYRHKAHTRRHTHERAYTHVHIHTLTHKTVVPIAFLLKKKRDENCKIHMTYGSAVETDTSENGIQFGNNFVRVLNF
jgi:hypothetical protein